MLPIRQRGVVDIVLPNFRQSGHGPDNIVDGGWMMRR